MHFRNLQEPLKSFLSMHVIITYIKNIRSFLIIKCIMVQLNSHKKIPDLPNTHIVTKTITLKK